MSQSPPRVTEDALPLAPISAWLSDQVPTLELPLELSVISAGRSNLTYLLTDQSGERFVARRPPTGPLAVGAHDVEREWQILSALESTEVPIPSLVGLYEASSEQLKVPCLVTRFVPGVPLIHETVGKLDQAAGENAADSIAETLAQVHSVDLDQVGLGHLRRDRPYVVRQINRWLRQLKHIDEPERLPAKKSLETLADEFLTALPPSTGQCLLHGDFKADNFMLDPVSGRLLALLDWELAAVGEPLADLAWLQLWWGDGVNEGPWLAPPVARAGTLPSSASIANRYAEITGRDLGDLEFYLAFAYWRLCAINSATRTRFTHGVMPGKQIDIKRLDEQIAWQTEAARTHLSAYTKRSLI